MRMHNPPHPGGILSELWLDPLDPSVTHAAEALDVSRKTLSEIVNGRAAISPEMAMQLEIAFGKSAESWSAHQAAFDLWAVDQRRDGPVTPRSQWQYPAVANKQKPPRSQSCAGVFGQTLVIPEGYLVEAAGIEPASSSALRPVLHT